MNRVTAGEIAELAGVSQSTVSRALRGSPLVNSKTRERVLRIANEKNYKVNTGASRVETLLDLVRGNDLVSRLLPPELIVRQSSRQLRAEDAASSRAGLRLTDTRRA